MWSQDSCACNRNHLDCERWPVPMYHFFPSIRVALVWRLDGETWAKWKIIPWHWSLWCFIFGKSCVLPVSGVLDIEIWCMLHKTHDDWSLTLKCCTMQCCPSGPSILCIDISSETEHENSATCSQKTSSHWQQISPYNPPPPPAGWGVTRLSDFLMGVGYKPGDQGPGSTLNMMAWVTGFLYMYTYMWRFLTMCHTC